VLTVELCSEQGRLALLAAARAPLPQPQPPSAWGGEQNRYGYTSADG